MRKRLFAVASLMTASFALADGAAKIDLDRPGALDRLQQDHPERYQRVRAVLLASGRAPCQGSAMGLLEAGLQVKDLECGMLVFTRYPALRHVSFELDGIIYAATVELETLDVPQPLATAEPPAAR